MARKIAKGDIVQLNSGSPDMVVISTENDLVTVEWKNQETLPMQCFHLVDALSLAHEV
jgi:uncharacterized protein YodC (DUF2158 family)